MCVGGTRRWLPLGLESVFVGLFKIIYAEPLPPPSPLHCTNKVEWHVSRRRDGPHNNLGNF